MSFKDAQIKLRQTFLSAAVAGESLMDQFLALDEAKTGHVEKAKLRDFLAIKLLPEKLDDTEWGELLDDFDREGEGVVYYEQFVSTILAGFENEDAVQMKGTKELNRLLLGEDSDVVDRLPALWVQFLKEEGQDVETKVLRKTLSHKSFFRCLRRVGMENILSRKKIEALINKIDLDGDQQISYEEFVSVIVATKREQQELHDASSGNDTANSPVTTDDDGSGDETDVHNDAAAPLTKRFADATEKKISPPRVEEVVDTDNSMALRDIRKKRVENILNGPETLSDDEWNASGSKNPYKAAREKLSATLSMANEVETSLAKISTMKTEAVEQNLALDTSLPPRNSTAEEEMLITATRAMGHAVAVSYIYHSIPSLSRDLQAWQRSLRPEIERSPYDWDTKLFRFKLRIDGLAQQSETFMSQAGGLSLSLGTSMIKADRQNAIDALRKTNTLISNFDAVKKELYEECDYWFETRASPSCPVRLARESQLDRSGRYDALLDLSDRIRKASVPLKTWLKVLQAFVNKSANMVPSEPHPRKVCPPEEGTDAVFCRIKASEEKLRQARRVALDKRLRVEHGKAWPGRLVHEPPADGSNVYRRFVHDAVGTTEQVAMKLAEIIDRGMIEKDHAALAKGHRCAEENCLRDELQSAHGINPHAVETMPEYIAFVTSTGKPDMLDTITQLRRRVRNKEKTRLRQLKAVCKSLDPGATGMISERSVLHRSTFPYVPRCALPLCRPRQYKAFWAQLCATSGAGKSGATHKQFLDFTMSRWSPSLFVNRK